MINDLSGKSDAQSLNQISRWVTTKESHAQNAQETILNYFLAQRVKAKEKGNKDRQKYVDQTLTLHQLIVKLMKCKQTVDQRNCSDSYELLDKFTNFFRTISSGVQLFLLLELQLFFYRQVIHPMGILEALLKKIY